MPEATALALSAGTRPLAAVRTLSDFVPNDLSGTGSSPELWLNHR